MTNTLFGKTYNILGSKDTNLILQTKGDIKIQYGNKYISLIKNGKINNESSVLNKISNLNDIINDGIYIDYLSGNINFLCGGELFSLNKNLVLYELQNLTLELKDLVLKNLGLLFSNLQEAQNSHPKYGFFCVLDTGKFYLIKDNKYIDVLENLNKQ